MNAQEIQRLFHNIKTWRLGKHQAPHKPLLLLYALARCQQDDVRLIPYTEIEHQLGKLLQTFGDDQSKPKAHYPFWRLQADGIWEVSDAQHIRLSSSGDPYLSDLRQYQVSGGFTAEVYTVLRSQPQLLKQIAQELLQRHLPSHQHKNIQQAIGLEGIP